MAKKEKEQQGSEEMTAEQARAFRASLYKPEKRVLTQEQKREEFRRFWAREKKNYGKSKNLEQILWVHLLAMKMDDPEKFEDGVKHFGLQKGN